MLLRRAPEEHVAIAGGHDRPVEGLDDVLARLITGPSPNRIVAMFEDALNGLADV
jgi:hypothetical protein